MDARAGTFTVGSEDTGMGVPTSFWNSRSERPRPKRNTPMPLIPCSALSVTLTTAVTSPMTAPIAAPTRTASQMLWVCSSV